MGTGEDSGDSAVNGGDGWYHISNLRGASGCWDEPLAGPLSADDGGPAMAASPLPLIHLTMKGAR